MFTVKDATQCIRNSIVYSRLSYGRLDCIKLGALGLMKELNPQRHARISRVARLLCRPMFVRPRFFRGLRILIDPRDAGQLDVFDEVVVQQVYDLSLVPFVPELVVDCGGHIGLFTVLAALNFPTAQRIVFEPVPGNLKYVKSTTTRNSLNAEIRAEAVSDKEGKATFYARTSSGGSLGDATGGVVGSFAVNVIDLVKFLADYETSRLLLKMDIEGEEENLLPKLLGIVPHDCAIFFETHRGEEGWNAVAGPLTMNGFDVKLLRKRDPYRDGFGVRQIEKLKQADPSRG